MSNKFYSCNSAGGSYKEHRKVENAVKRGVELGYYGILDAHIKNISSDELDELEDHMNMLDENYRFLI